MPAVPVREISLDRLKDWLDRCMAAHATPIALIAVGHDARSGELHCFRTEDGPSDTALGLLIGQVAVRLMHDDD